MENNEVMVTEMMPEEEFVETNCTGIVGFLGGLVIGGAAVPAIKWGVNKFKEAKAKREAKKAEAEKEEPKTEKVEAE